MFGSSSIRTEAHSTALSEPLSQIRHDLQVDDSPCLRIPGVPCCKLRIDRLCLDEVENLTTAHTTKKTRPAAQLEDLLFAIPEIRQPYLLRARVRGFAERRPRGLRHNLRNRTR